MGRRPRHCPSFFKILLGDFAHKLRIPLAFVAKFGGKLPSKAVIRSHHGESSWSVKIKRSGENHYCFKRRGWKKLVKDSQLHEGDFLTFHLISHSLFEMVGYAPNGCEKELIKPVAVKIETPASPAISEEYEEYPDNACTTRLQKYPVTVRTTRSRKSNESPARPYRKQSREVLAEAAESANQTHLSFSVVLKHHHRCCLSLPKAFAVQTGIARKKGVVLKNMEGKVWPVEIRVRTYERSSGRVDLSSGWSDFRAENLAYGDNCVFKFDHTDGNVIHVEVNKGRTK